MAYILSIETSGNNCSVALAKDGQLVSIRETETANSHASLSAVYVDEVLKEAGITPTDLSAIAVSEGPGSYTGLRIGVSLAKGLCYSLNVPLIAVPTLQAMAYEAFQLTKDESALYIPMIDARRMEVYTATYNAKLEELSSVKPLVLEPNSYNDVLYDNIVYFSGSGSKKWREITNDKNARFINIFANSSKNVLPLAHHFYNEKKFANISYFEPQYLKLFKEVI